MNRRGSKIILYPRGGLGNQLFQYGAALQLSKGLGLPIAINETLLDSNRRFNPNLKRCFLELNQFESSITETYSSGKLKSNVLTKPLTMERLLGDRAPKFLLKFGIFANEQQDQINIFRQASLSNDVVFGNRFIENAEYHSTFSRKIFSKGGSFLARTLLKIQVLDLTSGYQLFSREALLAILARGIRSKGPFFQTEMKYFACEMKFKYKEVPISYSNPSRQITLSDVTESLLSLFRLTILK